MNPQTTPEKIAPMIHWIRQEKVMLDRDLAELYGVETRALKQAVRRNSDRFPENFMFELEESEINALVSQNVIPSKGVLGGAMPMAFSEQGVAMLSSVLRGKRAVEVNIAIMRTFYPMGLTGMSKEHVNKILKKLREYNFVQPCEDSDDLYHYKLAPEFKSPHGTE